MTNELVGSFVGLRAATIILTLTDDSNSKIKLYGSITSSIVVSQIKRPSLEGLFIWLLRLDRTSDAAPKAMQVAQIDIQQYVPA